MITGGGPRRRALLALPLLGLAGCGGSAAQSGEAAGGDRSEPPSPSQDAVSAAPSPTPSGPGTWADQDPGQCVSLLQGYEPDEAVDLLVDGRAPRFATVQAAMDWADESSGHDRTWGYAGKVEGWTLLWEELGYEGSLAEVAARLSRRGVFASAYWNEDVGTAFTLARRGTVVRTIGPDHPSGSVGAPLPDEDDLGIGSDFPLASSLLVLLSRVTGTPVAEPSWRDRPDLLVFGLAL